jgi:hypothetical protein
MGILATFFSKVMMGGRTNSLDPELDPIRSEYPALLNSGVWTSGGRSSILVVPSGKVFHLKTIVFDNGYSGTNQAAFFDGSGASQVGPRVQVGQSGTEVITDLMGMLFYSNVHCSTVDSTCVVRIGGILRDS